MSLLSQNSMEYKKLVWKEILLVTGYVNSLCNNCIIDIINIISSFYIHLLICIRKVDVDRKFNFGTEICTEIYEPLSIDYNISDISSNCDGILGLINDRQQIILYPKNTTFCRSMKRLNGIICDQKYKHFIMYTKSKKLYGNGSLRHYYQENIRVHYKRDPVLIGFNFDNIITSIKIGYDFTVFLDNIGDVFKCQRNNPFKMKGLSNINTIETCGAAAFGINKDGVLYTFGAVNFGLTRNAQEPTDIIIDTATKYGPFLQSEILLKDIKSGVNNVLCLTIDNYVYTWGFNKHGQCGINDESRQIVKVPTKVVMKTKTTFIQCGNFHHIIIGSDNEFYSFGDNDNNKCLHSIDIAYIDTDFGREYDSIWKPTKIDIDDLKNSINDDIIWILPHQSDTLIISQKK